MNAELPPADPETRWFRLACDYQAEQMLLGRLLIDSGDLPAIFPLLSPDFAEAAHGAIFQAILDTDARGEPVHLAKLALGLEQSGVLAEVGGAPYLGVLVLTASDSSADLSELAARISVTALRRWVLMEYPERLRNAVADLHTMPYPEYLLTLEWQRTRQAAIERAGERCQLCGDRRGPFDVHHNDYTCRGFERAADLIALCRPCHEAFHARKPRHDRR